MATPRAQETRAFQAGNATGIPILRGLVDNIKIGSFWCRMDVEIGAAPTVISHLLGRLPTVVIVTGQQQAGSVFSTPTDRTAWTGASITLEASDAGLYSVLIG